MQGLIGYLPNCRNMKMTEVERRPLVDDERTEFVP